MDGQDIAGCRGGARHGRSARWPLHAPEQAAWVRDRLEEGHTFEEIRAMLEAGEFKPSPLPAGPADEGE